jgi:6-pyruvoyl-tetrahydropterin synthase
MRQDGQCTIAAEYSFEAAHHLPHVPDGHKCKRVQLDHRLLNDIEGLRANVDGEWLA